MEQGLATTLSSIPCLLQPHGPLPTLAHPLLLTLSYPQGATFFVPTKYSNFHRVNQKMAYVYGTLALRDAVRMVKMEAPFFQKHPETPDCPSLSLSVVFPIPWPPVHVSSFLHVHTITQSPQNPVLSCVPHVTLDGKVLLTGRPNTKGDASGVQKAVPLIHSSRTVDYSNEKPLPLSLAHGHKNDKCQWKPGLF